MPLALRPPCDAAQIRASQRHVACPPRAKRWVLATAILGSSLAFIEGSVVNLALPAIQSDLGTSSSGVQWVANAYLLTLVAFMLIGGSLADRYGLRHVFMLGVVVFALGALGAGLAPSLPLLIAARLVQGLGGAMLVPASLALVGSHFDEQERGRAIGTWAGASALTTAMGPVLGGWLVDQWGWPAVFLLIAPVAALTLASAAWRVPPSPAKHSERLDYAGAMLLAAALALLVYGLVHEGGAAARLALLAGAGVLGAAFVWRELRFDAPMLPLEMFRGRAFSGANAMTLLLYLALSGALYFLPFNLIQVQGYSATQAGAAFLPFSLIMGIGSTFAGDLIRRFDARAVLTLGPMVAALGLAVLAIPGPHATYASGFLPGIALVGIGMTLSVAPLTTVVMGSAGRRQAGTASGVNNTAARLGGVLAVAALTAVAVWQFESGLARRLHDAGVAPAVAERLIAEAGRLAELQPPAGMARPAADAIVSVVARAYVETFRVLVLICAALAAASGLIAWIALNPCAASSDRASAP
jgi:EmrB/QacA subfamily drug resistance transporter